MKPGKMMVKITETRDYSEDEWDDSANADISREKNSINHVSTIKKITRNQQ